MKINRIIKETHYFVDRKQKRIEEIKWMNLDLCHKHFYKNQIEDQLLILHQV